MNGVVCALALFFIQEPQSWTECVLGHQTAKQICVCQVANPTLSKCFKRNLCEVYPLFGIKFNPSFALPFKQQLPPPTAQLLK